MQVLRAALPGEPPVPVRRAVDIGCGAGPGAATLAILLPQTEVWAADIKPKALALTALNLALADVGNVHCAQSDLLRGVDGQFDLIVANPPFMLDTSQRAYCHGGVALGEGLSLDIVDYALERIGPGGRLLLSTCVAIIVGTDPFRVRVVGMLVAAECAWEYREIDPGVFGGELGSDLRQQADRIAAVVLLATMPIQ